jgi:hypothetical protein
MVLRLWGSLPAATGLFRICRIGEALESLFQKLRCQLHWTYFAHRRAQSFGYTPDGRYIIVVYEEIDGETVLPWTAYEVPEP